MNYNTLELQNPWWKGSMGDDFHLKELSRQTYIYDPKIIDVDSLFKQEKAIFTLIGPRQIGKTSYLKMLIKDIIGRINPLNIFYLSCENLNKEEFRQIFLSYLQDIAESGRKFIFLDEVSLVDGWEMVELELFNKGFLNDSVVINSGSSSINLKKSAERLPGRKGQGKTVYFLPLNFREFVFLVDKNAGEIAKKPLAYLNTLEKHFKDYLAASGFPKIINEYFAGTLGDSSYDIYKDWIEGEISKSGKSVNYAYQIFSKIIENLTSQINWESIVKNSTIKSHTTIADYVDMFDSLFITKVVNQISSDQKIRLAKNKKIYFFDHFIFSVIEKSFFKINNYSQYYREKIKESEYLSKVVENLVFSNILKEIVKQGYNINDTLFFWRSKTQQEVDFIINVRDGTERIVIPIEVKYRNKVQPLRIKTFTPFILSKDIYDLQKKTFPVPYFLFNIHNLIFTKPKDI